MKYFILLMLVFLVSCKEPGMPIDTNSNFKLELLFEHEGCKMYRFLDGGQYVYWSDCSGNTTMEIHHSSGKGGSYVTYMKVATTHKDNELAY